MAAIKHAIDFQPEEAGASLAMQEFIRQGDSFLPSRFSPEKGPIEAKPTVSVAGRIVHKGDPQSTREINLFPSLKPPKQPPPTKPEVAQAIAAMVAHEANATRAARVSKGLPPVPPPPPSQPKYPLVTDHVLNGVAEQIAKLPEPQRRQEIIAVHDHLTAALEEHGKFVLNGRLELLESPARAAEIAAQIINQKIAEIDKAQESAVEEARSRPAATPKPEPAGNKVPEAKPITTPVLAQTPAARPVVAQPAEIPTEDRNVLSTDDVRVVRARLERAGYKTWPPVRVGKRVFFPIRAGGGQSGR